MAILFFDTETSGFPSKKIEPTSQKNAWIVQIGMALTDNNGEIINQDSFLIKSNGRLISKGAQKVHQISKAQTDIYGVPESLLCVLFESYLLRVNLIVGHNISFDLEMVRLLLARNNMQYTASLIQNLPTKCTMKASTEFCKLPGKYGYKWPKLTELFHILFPEETFDAHDALEDIKATIKCYKELKNRNII